MVDNLMINHQGTMFETGPLPSRPSNVVTGLRGVPGFDKTYLLQTGLSSSQQPAPTSTDADTYIHSAVMHVNSTAVTQILSTDPGAIHEKGWNGQIALHVACLRGDIEMVRVLLDHGANPNQPNDSGETPTHYACRRGNPRIIHVLRQHGGLVDLADNLGRNGMHHAAQGGCVFMIKYLGEIGNLDYSMVDNALQTPLQIACNFMHKDAVTFLLKDKRSDPTRPDLYGQTAVHIAASKGDGETLWSLLVKSNCGQLEVMDRNGETPVHLANKGQGRRYEDLNKFLGRLKREPPSSIPTGPVILWYYFLLMPTVFPILYILVANFLSCFVAYVAAVWKTIYIWRSPARVIHYCRWPTPLYLGAFVSGYLHTVVFCFYTFLPVLAPSISMFLFALLCICATVYLFHSLMKSDPGRVAQSQSGLSILNVADGTLTPQQYCTICEIVTPMRTHHCRLCKACHRNMDHHCLYLLRCIAEKNHRVFLLFSSLIAVQQIVFLIYCIMFICKVHFSPGSDNVTKSLLELFSIDYWLVILFIYNLCTVSWMCPYLRHQLCLISQGETFVSHHSEQQNNELKQKLSFRQRLSNILDFFMERSLTLRNQQCCEQHV